jgi:hypothetical protein
VSGRLGCRRLSGEEQVWRPKEPSYILMLCVFVTRCLNFCIADLMRASHVSAYRRRPLSAVSPFLRVVIECQRFS